MVETKSERLVPNSTTVSSTKEKLGRFKFLEWTRNEPCGYLVGF